MSRLPLATPTDGQTFTIDGQDYLADATDYPHTVAFAVAPTGGGGGGDDPDDFFQEFFAELSSGAYGFPTPLLSGNLSFFARGGIWIIAFNCGAIEL